MKWQKCDFELSVYGLFTVSDPSASDTEQILSFLRM